MLPANITGLATLANTPTVSFGSPTANGPTLTAGTNGDLLAADPTNLGSYYYGKAATTSVEAEFVSEGATTSPGIPGIYVWDTNGGVIWAFAPRADGSNAIISYAYTGSSAPGTASGKKALFHVPPGVNGLKIVNVSGNLHFYFSLNGGITWIDYYSSGGSTAVIGSAGVMWKAGYADFLNIAIN